VTLRGKPLADIVPAGTAAVDDRMRELVASGRVVPPARARPTRPPQLVDAPGGASSHVLAERDDER
jgi:antitoxin (DNA-binding transcriptional repressor) of toxin-antitoxin stability system